MKQKIEIEVDIPEKWEATGEYRCPKEGEDFLDSGVDVVMRQGSGGRADGRRIILRKKLALALQVCRAVSEYGKQRGGVITDVDFDVYSKARQALKEAGIDP